MAEKEKPTDLIVRISEAICICETDEDEIKYPLCRSKLPDDVLSIKSYTGLKIRHFLNNLCEPPSTVFLEIGAWHGGTAAAAAFGNSGIFVFTWSAFGLIAWGSNWLNNKGWQWGGAYGFCGALFFYLYTNFGVWLIGGLYPHTFSGLMRSYWMGLPFLKIHAVSSVLFLSGTLGLLNLVNLRFRVSRWKSGAVPQL